MELIEKYLGEGKREEKIEKAKKELASLRKAKNLTKAGEIRIEKLQDALAKVGIFDI